MKLPAKCRCSQPATATAKEHSMKQLWSYFVLILFVLSLSILPPTGSATASDDSEGAYGQEMKKLEKRYKYEREQLKKRYQADKEALRKRYKKSDDDDDDDNRKRGKSDSDDDNDYDDDDKQDKKKSKGNKKKS
jgi:hypothetical protein